MTKILKRKVAIRVNKQLKEVYAQIEKAQQEQALIVYVDEVCFTNKTHETRAYSNRNESVVMDLSHFRVKTTAVIAAITHEHGMLLWKQMGKSANIEKFKDFLNALYFALPNRKLYVYMDNLSVHRSKKTLAHMETLGMVPIFGTPYSPQYNPIEHCFSVAKRKFRTDLAQRVATGKRQYTEYMINEAFKTITKQAVQNFIRRCDNLLRSSNSRRS